MEEKHIFIRGARGVGKTTLVNRLTADCPVPLYGFRDQKKTAENKMAKILDDIKPDGIILIDEIEYIDVHSIHFCANIFKCFDGDTPVIATALEEDCPGLIRELITHPNMDIFELTEENREELYEQLKPRVDRWIAELRTKQQPEA